MNTVFGKFYGIFLLTVFRKDENKECSQNYLNVNKSTSIGDAKVLCQVIKNACFISILYQKKMR